MATYWSYGFNIAVSVLAMMIAVGGISLGMGIAANNKRLKEFGRDELNQCLINGLLIGGLVALFVPSGIIPSLIGSIASQNATAECQQYLASNYAICFANGYLTGSGYSFEGSFHSSILSQSTSLIIGLLSLNTIIGLLASLKISILAVSFSLSQVMSPILTEIQFFVKALTTVSISVLVQSSILSAIAASSITVILPAGLILRTFYPTRKVGGFLISAVLGLYVVLPLTYVLNAAIASSYSSSLSNSTIVSLSASASSLNSYVVQAASSLNPSNSIVSDMSSYLSTISSQISGFAEQMMDYVSYFIMAAFILPAFSLVITLISIKELSAILGSEITFNIFDLV